MLVLAKAMFNEWMQFHAKSYPTSEEEELRFDNFQRHAYLKRALASRIVGSRDEATLPPGTRFNGRSKSIYWVSPRICSRTLMGYSRGGSLLPSSYADARPPDDVIAI